MTVLPYGDPPFGQPWYGQYWPTPPAPLSTIRFGDVYDVPFPMTPPAARSDAEKIADAVSLLRLLGYTVVEPTGA